METNRLIQFRAVVETGNFRKAAELLNMSHSGLSKSIKSLETELGYVLFQPSGRGVVVSDDGKRFYDRTHRFLEEYERLIGLDTPRSPHAVRIASFETFTSYFIGPLIKTHFKDREVEIHELVPGRLEDALVYEKVDFGITYEPQPQKGVEFVKATSIQMGAYSLKGTFQDMDLADIPFVTPVLPLDGAPSVARGRDAWPDTKIKRNVQFQVDLMTTGLEIVRQGLAAIFIPRFVAQLHNERSDGRHHIVPLKLPRGLSAVKCDVYIAKRESMAENQDMRLIARALREICADD